MDDLISKKGLLNKINAYVCGSQDKEFICKLIAVMPTIDAVEVVRCKDCKNRYRTECSMKYLAEMRLNDTDFCSLGERKTNDS